MAFLEINFGGEKATKARRGSTKPNYKVRQFNLGALRDDYEQLEYEAARIAFTYATGHINEDDVRLLVEKNKDGQPYGLSVDDNLFDENVEMNCVYVADNYEANSNVAKISYKGYCEEEKEERTKYKYPLVQLYFKDTKTETVFNGFFADKPGKKAHKFADVYGALLQEFSNLPSLSGKKKYVLGNIDGFLPKNNIMPKVAIGTTDKEGYFEAELNLALERLEKMDPAKRLQLLQNIIQMADVIREEAVSAMKKFYGEKATANKPEKNEPQETKLFRLVEKSTKWKNLDKKQKLEDALAQYRAGGITDDDDIIGIFVVTGQFKAEIEEIEREMAEEAKKAAEQNQQNNQGNHGQNQGKNTGKGGRNQGKGKNQPKNQPKQHLTQPELRTPKEWAEWFNDQQITIDVESGMFDRFNGNGINIFAFRNVYKVKKMAIPDKVKAEFQKANDAERKAQAEAAEKGGA